MQTRIFLAAVPRELKEHEARAAVERHRGAATNGLSAKIELPFDPSGSHYYAARGTEAAMLRVPVEEKKTEVEKFLFYRGVAHFQAPLTVKPDAADGKSFTLTNNGGEVKSVISSSTKCVTTVVCGWPTDALKPSETRQISLAAAAGVHSDDRGRPFAGQGDDDEFAAAQLFALSRTDWRGAISLGSVGHGEDMGVVMVQRKGLRVLYTLAGAPGPTALCR